jgi:Trypsin-like peptidase domain
MHGASYNLHRNQSRRAHNEEFVRRLYARRPDAKQEHDRIIKELAAHAEPTQEVTLETALQGESVGRAGAIRDDALLETIVLRERPVLFVRNDWIDRVNVTLFGDEAKDLVSQLDSRRDIMQPLMPLIGRIDVVGFPGNDFLGTGWFVDANILITNRHVASLIARQDGRKFAFARGVGAQPLSASVSTLHEFDDLTVDTVRAFAVEEVLYIEPDNGPDIAFLRVARRTDGSRPDRIAIAAADVGADVPVFVVGYPARAPRSVIPDQQLMKELYRDRYDVKRAAPGFTMAPREGATRHDCTTLGGNSGSVVLELASGKAVGLHFAGLYQETNYAVRASVLADYISHKRWNQPVMIETKSMREPSPPSLQSTRKPQLPGPAAPSPRALTIPISLSISISLGQPTRLLR